MKVEDAIQLKDSFIKAILKHNLVRFVPEDLQEEFAKQAAEEIEDVFTSANAKYEERLEDFFGEEKEQNILDHLKADI